MILLPRLIGIAGKAGSGKDVAADFLRTRYNFDQYKMSGQIKAGLAAMFDLDPSAVEGSKERTLVGDVTIRQALQTLGTDWGRNLLHSGIWIEGLARRWDELNAFNHVTYGELPGLVISDIRFDNEADWITNNGGVVIRIDRPRCMNSRSVPDHASEQGIDEACIDTVVDNDCEIIDFLQRFVSALENLATQATGLASAWRV